MSSLSPSIFSLPSGQRLRFLEKSLEDPRAKSWQKIDKKDLAVPSMIMYFHINLQKVCESVEWHKGCDTFKFHTCIMAGKYLRAP